MFVMAMAWLAQRRSGNAGVVDPIWAASLGVLALVYACFSDGWGPRRVMVALLVGIWSARLTWHLLRRVSGEPEDGRYAILRDKWGKDFEPWIFWFFQAQAVLAVLLSLGFLFLCQSKDVGWRIQDGAALGLWCLSILGEGLADRQLHAWRSDPSHRGRTCRRGLWAYSRHPNYFFEWLHWMVYPVLGVGMAMGWSLWFIPLVMLFLVLRVTGIPPTEEQSLRSRGEDYRAYQRSTNAFFPGPPKHLSPEYSETK